MAAIENHAPTGVEAQAAPAVLTNRNPKTELIEKELGGEADAELLGISEIFLTLKHSLTPK